MRRTIPIWLGCFLAFSGASLYAMNPSVNHPRVFSSRWFVAHMDEQLIAGLVGGKRLRNDFELRVTPGQIKYCGASTCRLPLTLTTSGDAAPLKVFVAVTSPNKELSPVQHAECPASRCQIELVVQRGENTIAIGAGDEIAQTAGFVKLAVNVTRHIDLDAPTTGWF